ncbi:hypothetical protein GR268_44910, partial [Rhizobium leguminosarum]|nr:hypothetical protein [Rhizobium leguminosarum]
CIHTYFWLIGHEIDFLFSKLKDYRPDNIPSFPFYRLMGEIRNLDPAFWPHLQGTNVQVINLSANAIEDTKATNFSQSLRGTRVKEVELMANIIEGIQAINLQGTRVHTVGLSYNQITAAGGTREFAQNLRGTEVKTINLTGNKIGDAGVIEFAQNLQETNVEEVILW